MISLDNCDIIHSMANKGQKHINKLLKDFLPETITQTTKPKRKPKAENRPLTLKQKRLVTAYLDKDNPKTFGNGTQSALVAYNIDPSNTNLAGQMAHQQLNNPKLINYLERHCEKMGIGIEVRLDSLRTFIQGRSTQKTVIRHKTPDRDTGKLKTVRTQEIEAPPRIHDRIAAIKELNNMTGFYKQQEIDKQIALSEVNDMYKRIVGRDTGTGKPA